MPFKIITLKELQIVSSTWNVIKKYQAWWFLNHKCWNLILDVYSKLMTDELWYRKISLFLHYGANISQSVDHFAQNHLIIDYMVILRQTKSVNLTMQVHYNQKQDWEELHTRKWATWILLETDYSRLIKSCYLA